MTGMLPFKWKRRSNGGHPQQGHAKAGRRSFAGFLSKAQPRRQHIPPTKGDNTPTCPAVETDTDATHASTPEITSDSTSEVGFDADRAAECHSDAAIRQQDSQTLDELLDEVMSLAKDERLVAALQALEELEQRLGGCTGADDEGAVARVRVALEQPDIGSVVQMIRTRGPLCRQLMQEDLNHSGWSLVSQHDDTKTWCQPVGDGRTMRIRLESWAPGFTTEQIALIREAHLFSAWMPLCKDSKMLHRIGKTEMLFWMKLGLGRLACWDLVMHGWSCDCIAEDGSILIFADEVVTTDLIPPEDIPPPPKRLGSWRVSLRDFKVRWQFHSMVSTSICMEFCLDPKISGVQGVVNFAIKRCAALVLSVLKREAQRMARIGLDHPHIKGPLSHDPFWQEFYMPRLLWFCRVTGFEYPQYVHTLGVDVANTETIDPYPTRVQLTERIQRADGKSGSRADCCDVGKAIQTMDKSEERRDITQESYAYVTACENRDDGAVDVLKGTGGERAAQEKQSTGKPEHARMGLRDVGASTWSRWVPLVTTLAIVAATVVTSQI